MRLFLAVLLAAACGARAFLEDDIVMGEDPRKPIEVDDQLMCHACNAAVIETVKHVS